MQVRGKIRFLKSGTKELKAARASVDAAKRALGERGPVWWKDGAQDYNRYLAKNTPYADWYAASKNQIGTAQASHKSHLR